MRIIDWSSDLCSSDLHGLQVGEAFARPVGVRRQAEIEQDDRWSLATQHRFCARSVAGSEYLEIVESPGQLALEAEVVFDEQELWRISLSHPVQIGRASCRERVCQYV